MSIALGSPAPTFALPATDGSTVSLASLRSDARAVIVAFWCNHCPYVQAWEDRLAALVAEWRDRGLAAVAINANDVSRYPADSFQSMVERAGERGYTFAYAFDESQEVPRAYGAERTPEVFLLDDGARVAYHGAIDDATDPGGVTETYLADAIEAVMAGERPAVAETAPVGCTIKWRSARGV